MTFTLSGKTKKEFDELERQNPGYLKRLAEVRARRMQECNRAKFFAQSDTPCPRQELFDIIAKNDDSEECKHAVWRANQLFGDTWKKKSKK